MKLWAGRFSKEVDETVNDFNSSISFDARMARQDIKGSMAHARMLAACGIVSAEDAEAILCGLEGILEELEAGKLEIDPAAEDIHTFIEAELTARIGDAGKRLHTARSRNDQVALDLRLYLEEQIVAVHGLICQLLEELCAQAEKSAFAIMPGYTHMQRAQPVSFGHHLMAYAAMLLRDLERLGECRERMRISPLGSGALAGTTYPIDRAMTARLLGMREPCANSMDGVSDRDFCIELAADLSIVMMHLSRLSEEIILWCSWEFRFIELDDAYTTGSSIMPQKKNPDVAELIRGKTGRVYGDLTCLLTMMKGLPMAYDKDMQEDKEAIFDALDTVVLCLSTMAPMICTMKVLPENMRAAAAKGFINATDCADYLARKGMPFRDAYRLTGQIVAHCIDQNKTLEALSLEQYQAFSPMFGEDIYSAISLENCLAGRTSYGGPTGDSVLEQVRKAREQMAELSIR